MKKSLLLLFLVVILAIIPLITQQGTEFGGADGVAEEAITKIQPEYKPWFNSIWEPPGAETESLLFALQAAIGAGFIGYFIGVMRQKNKQSVQEKDEQAKHVTHR
ncbi:MULTISPECIES: energy-coupling factor ABC transporter substrate-binding protein [Peribacillus]|uniref:energy-coupling factor ABC transporter substrate-binding protein n=1 Tax=Peribacillus TaxID=2675229 RepID=UPI00191329B3|nr:MULTISPECIES: energy-coupling factor ABC transporter substrate-binding protein [unclassified Peribacillus]MBK5446573.1 energy-coupling factor ABC transporter substrate-binding protein [Peribacillus sp. TH24]MBK5458706.1 energy-coupling factor ABC transporter substrate-binding protein [Peribacillus sp. TH27]MBK5480613.1 energy-coupling factor ABC transporter substrate-binding protein [Peribacillus sp. TH16]MBK5502119.1 energy-coupling factor ABC transporter substrate-binding protein [Peribaci